MSERRTEPQGESLNESWVELHFRQQAEQAQDPANTRTMSSLESSLNGNYERLLIEAQNESRTASSTSSRGSPKGSHSPTSQDVPKQLGSGEWIWDWSSRPEAIPPAGCHLKYKHPTRSRKTKLSVRNTRVMRNGIFCLENLPTLFLTHACTFFLGAATMFICLRRYGQIFVSTSTIVD